MCAVSVHRTGSKALLCLIVASATLATAGSAPRARFAGGRRVVFTSEGLVSRPAAAPEGTFHQETSIAAFPDKHAKRLVAGQMEFHPGPTPNRPCVFSVSDDKGVRWKVQGTVPERDLPGLNACSDPSLAVDPEGTFYFAFLDQNAPAPGQYGTTALLVARGSGEGPWFQEPVTAVAQGPGEYLDKPYLAADRGADSPFAGTLYLTYTNFLPTGERILVVVSRDGGATWSAPIPLDGPPAYPFGLLGSVPAVAADGTVYIFWARYSYAGTLAIRFSRSTDGGATWSRWARVAPGRLSSGSYYLHNADPMYGTAPNRGVRGNSFPSAAVTPDGAIFVTWTDFQDGSCDPSTPAAPVPPCHNADVRLSVSRDGGTTWSDPVKPTDETGDSDQFLPWLAAHPDGLVSLAWLDRRLDPDNVDYDVYYTNTYDGATFLPNVRVTSVSSAVGETVSIGDYNGITATEKEVFPVWGDLRDGKAIQIYGATAKLIGVTGKDAP